jgi:hypothetical protein
VVALNGEPEWLLKFSSVTGARIVRGIPARIQDRIRRDLGDVLFVDVDAIPLGVNFVKFLRRTGIGGVRGKQAMLNSFAKAHLLLLNLCSAMLVSHF